MSRRLTTEDVVEFRKGLIRYIENDQWFLIKQLQSMFKKVDYDSIRATLRSLVADGVLEKRKERILIEDKAGNKRSVTVNWYKKKS